MGQGTSKYRKIMRTPQTGENAGKKLWYATAVSDREMSFEDFVTHISEHNSPYSRGTIHGVLMDTLDCLKHLILDGKSVRFSDLGLFSIGMTSHGEVSKEKVTAVALRIHRVEVVPVRVLAVLARALAGVLTAELTAAAIT